MPNFQGRYLKQGTSGTYGNESLPNITGEFASGNTGFNIANGVFYGTNNYGSIVSVVGTYPDDVYFDASRSSSVYQNNAKVNPDNAEIMYCIKY
ncbi:MAG: hypothetical protein IKS93_04640 [Methanobrevibacter sp.]|nr:hypothetical protein [Methanobrevibacter sp.]